MIGLQSWLGHTDLRFPIRRLQNIATTCGILIIVIIVVIVIIVTVIIIVTAIIAIVKQSTLLCHLSNARIKTNDKKIHQFKFLELCIQI